MLVQINENEEVTLNEKAYMIKDFRKLYDHICDTADKDLALSAFAFLHYMYHFDSRFVLAHPEEEERIKAVKKFIHRGSEIKIGGTRIMRKAMDTYQELYEEEQVSLYRVMHNNLFKLKEYAECMILKAVDTVEDNEGIIQSVLVDSKEFTTVNSMLPKQQKELEDFEARLIESNKNKIDIYGGKKANVYE